MNPNHKQKLEAAKSYLRLRNIYITECDFKPTSAAATDVTVTMARYRKQVLDNPLHQPASLAVFRKNRK